MINLKQVLDNFWDEWRGQDEKNPTMWLKRLIHVRGFRLDLHKMVAPDNEQCFHTHPAKAIRFVLWGGYIEQLNGGAYKLWKSFSCGIVQPELSHRIDSLWNGVSYSLWFRWPCKYDVFLTGDGWKEFGLTNCACGKITDHSSGHCDECRAERVLHVILPGEIRNINIDCKFEFSESDKPKYFS